MPDDELRDALDQMQEAGIAFSLAIFENGQVSMAGHTSTATAAWTAWHLRRVADALDEEARNAREAADGN